ncbi:MAG: (deoxy)nucleoside triphosphate pyrophosphohydrolase [Syntrophorhabdaceae bacterium]
MRKKANPKIVAIAIIEKNGDILIGKRKRGKRHVGNWEFPGGTVEKGETYEQCLTRELYEEFTVTAEIGDFICSTEYQYTTEWTIKLSAYRTKILSGDFNLKDHDEVRWVHPAELPTYMPDGATRSILDKLSGTDLQLF